MQKVPNDVVIKAQEGDMESFEQIYRITSGFIYSTIFRIIHNRQDSEDALQEVFLKAYRHLIQFRFKSSFTTWIYRIAVNTALTRCRKKKSDIEKMRNYKNSLNLNVDRVGSESSLDKEAKNELINKLLSNISPSQRACIILREIKGLSYKEIADVMRTNINTVRSRLKRAREKLMAV